METTNQDNIQQQDNILQTTKAANDGQERSEEHPKQDHHTSATYAANQWHSAVKHAHPQRHRGIDI